MAIGEEALQVFADTIFIKVSSRDTGGTTACWIEKVPSQAGTPVHKHGDCGETAYILKGQFKISADGDIREIGPGECAHFPVGCVHALKNISDEEGEMLVTISPGGFEVFFEEISKNGLTPPDDMPAIAKLAGKYRMDIVGPPMD